MTYILFDAHNFYVSAELVFRPELRNKPVVVISSNDGCVISRSQAAKDIGIKMGEPAHFIREEFWRHNVKIFSANFPLYWRYVCSDDDRYSFHGSADDSVLH